MERLSNGLIQERKQNPVRFIQIGEGRFMRGFVDLLIEKANQDGRFNGSGVIIKPRDSAIYPSDVKETLGRQDNLYTVVCRDADTEEATIVTCIDDVLSSDDWNKVLDVVANPDVDFLFSQTTGAGISLDKARDYYDDQSTPPSFPGKVVSIMYHRYQTRKGMDILPTELVCHNGDRLRELCYELIDKYDMGTDFKEWSQRNIRFHNTLVDKIVTGFPGMEEAEQYWHTLGYQDFGLNVAEPYSLWLIEDKDKSLRERFPLDHGVEFVDDITPYEERKLRILNGLHTSMVFAADLLGVGTVAEVMDHRVMSHYVKYVGGEIVRTFDEDQKPYADSVLDRFRNPYIQHYIEDIVINPHSKVGIRILPTVKRYYEKYGELPPGLTLGLACYALHTGDPKGLDSIPGLVEKVEEYKKMIYEEGIPGAMISVVYGGKK